jgi:calcium-dependent protein kinase
MQKNPKDRMPASAAIKHPWIVHASKLHDGPDAAHEMAAHNDIIESLEAFSHADDLKKLALESIAFSTPPAKLDELRKVFVSIDVDDSGTISLDEFKKAMLMHPELSQDKVEAMFKNMDVNDSGEVDYLEFISATISTQKSGSDKMSAMAAFSILDADGDGYITKEDIWQATEGTYSETEVSRPKAHSCARDRLALPLFLPNRIHGSDPRIRSTDQIHGSDPRISSGSIRADPT